ncbi:MAG TPA: DapH/DapD/GlmU-related protein [Caulobacteraceae bacterium]|jgi:acetyltransferase-like isoleucine patch superfamily enzyme
MRHPRLVKAVHGRLAIEPDPDFEAEFAIELSRRSTPAEIMSLFRRFNHGDDYIDSLMRRTCVRALARRCGEGLRIAPGVGLRHVETFEIGDGVTIGEQAVIHGRHDGRCVIGNKVWIGAQAFLDVRDAELGDHVGWGPGARLLGSMHTGLPIDVPIIATDLLISPTTIEAEADIGVNAVILPGVTVGKGAIVGAGAVVTHDVPAYARAAGAPARVISTRVETSAKEGAPT